MMIMMMTMMILMMVVVVVTTSGGDDDEDDAFTPAPFCRFRRSLPSAFPSSRFPSQVERHTRFRPFSLLLPLILHHLLLRRDQVEALVIFSPHGLEETPLKNKLLLKVVHGKLIDAPAVRRHQVLPAQVGECHDLTVLFHFVSWASLLLLMLLTLRHRCHKRLSSWKNRTLSPSLELSLVGNF